MDGPPLPARKWSSYTLGERHPGGSGTEILAQVPDVDPGPATGPSRLGRERDRALRTGRSRPRAGNGFRAYTNVAVGPPPRPAVHDPTPAATSRRERRRARFSSAASARRRTPRTQSAGDRSSRPAAASIRASQPAGTATFTRSGYRFATGATPTPNPGGSPSPRARSGPERRGGYRRPNLEPDPPREAITPRGPRPTDLLHYITITIHTATQLTGGRPLRTTSPERRRDTAAARYVANIAASARSSTRASLDRAARLALGTDHADGITYPWHRRPPETFVQLRADLAERYASATANASIAAIRGALRIAWIAGDIDHERWKRATAALRRVRGKSVPGRALDPAQVRRLFAAAAADPNRAAGARDSALLALLYGLGLRRAEAAASQLTDLDHEAGTLRVASGKGGKGRLQPIGLNGAAQAIEAWIRRRGRKAGPLLAPVNKGGRIAAGRGMTGTAIAARTRTLGERAGLGPIGPHTLRRSFATQLLTAGNDLAVTGDLMGHQDLNTTRIYDRRGERAKRAAAATLSVPYVAPE